MRPDSEISNELRKMRLIRKEIERMDSELELSIVKTVRLRRRNQELLRETDEEIAKAEMAGDK